MSNTPGPERYAIIELPDGPPPANSMMTGPLDTILKWLPDTLARNDEIKRLDAARIKADQINKIQNVTHALQIAAFCDSVTTLSRRLDTFEQRRVESIIAARKRDQEREHQLIEDQIARSPNPDDPHAWDDPPPPAADLHTVPPSPGELDDAGPVPLSYGKMPLSYVKAEKGDQPAELTNKVPVDPGTDPNLSGSREPEARNPVGISW